MIIGPRASLVCHEGTYHLWRRIPPGEKSIDRKLTSGVAGELARRSLVTKVALGGRAIQRAVTRVKPEQASKVKSRMPIRLNYGEGRAGGGSNRHRHPTRFAGVVGTARWKGEPGNGGDPLGRGSRPQRRLGRRFWRESDRVIVPLRPVNAGGGKDPDFWCAFEEAEDG